MRTRTEARPVDRLIEAFYGASGLLTHRFTDAQTLARLLGGLALIFVLAVWQHQPRTPALSPTNLSTTIPGSRSPNNLKLEGARHDD